MPDSPSQADRDRRIRLRAAEIDCDRAERDRIEGQRLARRIFVAGALILVTAVICFVVLPAMKLHLPPVVPVVAFGAITLGALLTGHAEGKVGAHPRKPAPDDGCAVGCCSGPRPPRFTRDQ